MNNSILNHDTGLIRYWALRYLARLPTRSAESGSLTLCAVHFLSLPSDPAVTSNALAIRIVFPLIGVTPVSYNRPGLPATLGKPKNRPSCIQEGRFDYCALLMTSKALELCLLKYYTRWSRKRSQTVRLLKKRPSYFVQDQRSRSLE